MDTRLTESCISSATHTAHLTQKRARFSQTPGATFVCQTPPPCSLALLCPAHPELCTSPRSALSGAFIQSGLRSPAWGLPNQHTERLSPGTGAAMPLCLWSPHGCLQPCGLMLFVVILLACHPQLLPHSLSSSSLLCSHTSEMIYIRCLKEHIWCSPWGQPS